MTVPIFNYHSSIITIMVKKQYSIIYQTFIKQQICSKADTK